MSATRVRSSASSWASRTAVPWRSSTARASWPISSCVVTGIGTILPAGWPARIRLTVSGSWSWATARAPSRTRWIGRTSSRETSSARPIAMSSARPVRAAVRSAVRFEAVASASSSAFDLGEQVGRELVVQLERLLALEVGRTDAEQPVVAGVVLAQQLHRLVVGQQQLQVADRGGLDAEVAVELVLGDDVGPLDDEQLLLGDREPTHVELADQADLRLGLRAGVRHGGDAEGHLGLEARELVESGTYEGVRRAVAQPLRLVEERPDLLALGVGQVGLRPRRLQAGRGLVDLFQSGLALLLVLGPPEHHRRILGGRQVGDRRAEHGDLAGGRGGGRRLRQLGGDAESTQHRSQEQGNGQHECDLADHGPFGHVERAALRLLAWLQHLGHR